MNKNAYLMYGLVTAVAMIIISVIVMVAGIAFKPNMQYVSDVPFLIGMIMLAIAYSKSKEGFVTFGELFGTCFKACLIIAGVLLVWSFISLAIFPDIPAKAMDAAQQRMAEKGLSQDQIDRGTEMAKKFMKQPFMSLFVIIGTLFFGAIFSLIAAAIAKKKGPRPGEMPF